MASVGYKACKNNRIVELEPLGRNNEGRKDIVDSNYAKMRCESARVIRIYDADTKEEFDTAESFDSLFSEYNPIIYHKDKVAKPIEPYNEDIDKVCASGIHYFKTFEPAYMHTRYMKRINYHFDFTGKITEWCENGKFECEKNYEKGKEISCKYGSPQNNASIPQYFYAAPQSYTAPQYYTVPSQYYTAPSQYYTAPQYYAAPQYYISYY